MRIIVVLFAVVLLAACTEKNRVPSDILSKEKMGDIIWDMVQAEQYSAIYVSKDTPKINLRTEDLRLYQKVFQMHQVSKDEFSKSLQYYEDRPELLRTVFDSLLSKGNRLRTESYRQSVLTPTASPATIKPATPAVVTPYSAHGQAPSRSPIIQSKGHGQAPSTAAQGQAHGQPPSATPPGKAQGQSPSSTAPGQASKKPVQQPPKSTTAKDSVKTRGRSGGKTQTAKDTTHYVKP